jgi:hypothetical protein
MQQRRKLHVPLNFAHMKLAADESKNLTPERPSLVRTVGWHLACHFGAGQFEFRL